MIMVNLTTPTRNISKRVGQTQITGYTTAGKGGIVYLLLLAAEQFFSYPTVNSISIERQAVKYILWRKKFYL
jgi:hypothetical protein